MMSKFDSPEGDALDSALLLLSRQARDLAALLEHLLSVQQIQELAKLAGRRKPGRPEPCLQVADALPHSTKLRAAVVEQFLHSLPIEGDPAPDEWLGEASAALVSSPARLLALRNKLTSSDSNDWEIAAGWLEKWRPFLKEPLAGIRPSEIPPKQARASFDQTKPQPGAATGSNSAKAAGSNSAAPIGPSSAVAGAEARKKLQEQLLEARREASASQEKLGAERDRKQALQIRLDEAKLQAEHERQRATEFKQRLSAITKASEREQILENESLASVHRLYIAEQKLDWLEEERDDLRGILEDKDRFDQMVEEQVPSFRNRPLTTRERDLAEQLALRVQAGKNSFRILVVGGAEPQYRHRDKFLEYSQALGFSSLWRMAEYQSWHRELDALARDMRVRFDALIILHWNRTTFTRKARGLCDLDGNKPCLTCHYEGFTNLRESLQECLRQLLTAEARKEGRA
jgi:hypothetical protein